MKISKIHLSIFTALLTLSGSAAAEDQYIVRVPANVNLSAATPETPSEPLSVVLSPEALPAATVNEPYSFNLADRLSITGGTGSYNIGDVTWSLKAGDSLPPGLSLSNGTIAGTPTVKNEAGTSFEVTGTYQDASGQQVYAIVVGGQTLKVKQISAGGINTCAATIAGAAVCWGNNTISGQYHSQNRPIVIAGLESGVSKISIGDYHACAIQNGALKCWGNNHSGQIGNGETSNGAVIYPVSVIGMDSEVSDVAAGSRFTCSIKAGQAYCWGENTYSNLGLGFTGGAIVTPMPVADSGVATKLTAGEVHACAYFNGIPKCWGHGAEGQLGLGDASSRHTPTPMTDTSWSSLKASYRRTCGVKNGGAYCWGQNSYGELGIAGGTSANVPNPVQDLASGVTGLAGGNFHTCAIQQGTVKCWGASNVGQLGLGSIASSATPAAVQGLNNVSMLVAAGMHTCAVTTSGATKCWGDNQRGQLGDGTFSGKNTPVDVLP